MHLRGTTKMSAGHDNAVQYMFLLDVHSGCFGNRARVPIGSGFQKGLMFELNPGATKELPRRRRPGRE